MSLESSDNLRLYSFADDGTPPVWRDTEFFPTDNDNLNGTAAVDFGNDVVFALDTNNGLLALRVWPQVSVGREDLDIILQWAGSFTLQSASNLQPPVDWKPVDGASSPYRVTPAGTGAGFYRLVGN